MISASHTTARFRKTFQNLPPKIQRQARKAFKLWKANQKHKSLHFKQVHPTEPVFSVRIGLGWRALGLRENDVMIWFWIGSHADYDQLLSQL